MRLQQSTFSDSDVCGNNSFLPLELGVGCWVPSPQHTSVTGRHKFLGLSGLQGTVISFCVLKCRLVPALPRRNPQQCPPSTTCNGFCPPCVPIKCIETFLSFLQAVEEERVVIPAHTETVNTMKKTVLRKLKHPHNLCSARCCWFPCPGVGEHFPTLIPDQRKQGGSDLP